MKNKPKVIIDGIKMTVYERWTTCGHKETRNSRYVRCVNCYPSSGKVYASHGPFFDGVWRENGKERRKYLGASLDKYGKVTV